MKSVNIRPTPDIVVIDYPQRREVKKNKLRRIGCALVAFAGLSLLYPASALAAPVCDGVTDDTAQVIAAAISGTRLPAGDCRVTSDIAVTTPNPGIVNPGMRLCGAGMLRTRIVADYNGSVATGGVVSLTASAVGRYTLGSKICDLTITQKSGRTGLNGIQLTAGWFVEIDKVKVENMSGTGIKVPLRTDLHPTLSDGYQNFSLIVTQSWINTSAGWGIDFGAGQSPGAYKIQYSAISNNAGGGIRSTTGQCEIIENVIVGNGTFGTLSGGLLFDTAEGPSMVAKVERNEFDVNYNWHVSLLRSRDMELRQNRFLSQTYNAAQNGALTPGGTYMRPAVHVTLGSGATNEVWNLLAVRNLHRSVTPGPSSVVTTASVIAYTASSGSLSAAHPVRLERNDFGELPANGLHQNSTGLSKYVNFTGTGAEIIDP